MTLTEEDARRIADAILETFGRPVRERIKRVHTVVPHAKPDDIKRALETHIELVRLDETDAKLELEELQRELDRLPKDD